MIFKAYVNTPGVAFYGDEYDNLNTPPLAAVLKVSLEDKHIGKTFQVGARRFRIQSISHVYEPDMVGEIDEHGDFRIISTEEIDS